jgi:hypothetical protein
VAKPGGTHRTPGGRDPDAAGAQAPTYTTCVHVATLASRCPDARALYSRSGRWGARQTASAGRPPPEAVVYLHVFGCVSVSDDLRYGIAWVELIERW